MSSDASTTKTLTPSALGEVAVWEAFRALRTEGMPIHACLVKYLREHDIFRTPGETLEIGGGDGELWRAGGEELVATALSAGALHVADSDPQLVEKCRTSELLGRENVVVEVADVTRLLYRDRQFARIIVVHVLHWCQRPDLVRQAVLELARVLQPGGRALVVTVDERIHMAEIYQLMKQARDRVLGQGLDLEEEIPSASPRVLPFCAGNAVEFLQGAFASVHRVDCNYAHLVEAQHPSLGVSGEEFFVSYLRTLPFIKEAVGKNRLPEVFFEEVRRLFKAHMAAHGTFRMSRCDVIYDCAAPRVRGGELR